MDNIYVFENNLSRISEELENILEDYPESNGGYDYIVDAIRYINIVLDEYMQ